MHERRFVLLTLLLAAAVLLLPVASPAQSMNGSVSGTVVDPSGAPVPGTEMVLKNTGTGVELRRTSETSGGYAFRNLVPGTYELTATIPGFEPFARRGILVPPNGDVRLDVGLAISGQTEQVEVVGASTLQFDSGSREGGIAPETLQDLPLVFNSGPRSSATFVLLMPGVSSGGSANAFDARINGGLQSGDEAVLDGASMQQGFMSQSGMVSIFNDFPYSPDMVSEIKVVSSSYDAQYGSTTGGQIVAVTKSGQEKFHGALFEYAQRDKWNANQWGATEKSPLTEEQLRRQPRRADEDPRPVVELGQDLLLRRRRGLSPDGRGDPEHAVHPLDEAAQRRLQRLARRERQPHPDLRPGHDPSPTAPSSPSRATSSRRTGSPTSPRATCSTCRRPPTTTRSTTTSCRAPFPTRSSATATTSWAASTRTSARRTTSPSRCGTSAPPSSTTRSCRTSWRRRRRRIRRTPRSTG